MEINYFVLNLFLILLPGVISTIMVRYVTTNQKYTIFEFVIYSAVLGIGTFIGMEFLLTIWNIILSIFGINSFHLDLNLTIWDNLFTEHSKLNKHEVFISYIMSIPFGLLCAYLITHNKIIKLLQKFKLTTRFGDNDVWNFYLNSPNTEWIYLHNKRSNLTYFGKIRAFSDSGEKREILIEDVVVYLTSTWEKLYLSDAVYLELNNYDFTIETPKIEKEENESI